MNDVVSTEKIPNENTRRSLVFSGISWPSFFVYPGSLAVLAVSRVVLDPTFVLLVFIRNKSTNQTTKNNFKFLRLSKQYVARGSAT